MNARHQHAPDTRTEQEIYPCGVPKNRKAPAPPSRPIEGRPGWFEGPAGPQYIEAKGTKP